MVDAVRRENRQPLNRHKWQKGWGWHLYFWRQKAKAVAKQMIYSLWFWWQEKTLVEAHVSQKEKAPSDFAENKRLEERWVKISCFPSITRQACYLVLFSQKERDEVTAEEKCHRYYIYLN